MYACTFKYIYTDNKNCIPEDECGPSSACPLRCERGENGCNWYMCDRLGNVQRCQTKGCPDGPDPFYRPGCFNCEVGYKLDSIANTCIPGKFLYQKIIFTQIILQIISYLLDIYLEKKTCTSDNDCSEGYKCKTDPECRDYTDLKCTEAQQVCVISKPRERCTKDTDCDHNNGFRCLNGDKSKPRCVRYESPEEM